MNDEVEMLVTLDGSDTVVTLTDLAGLDMSDVSEVRGFPVVPGGAYRLRNAGADIESLTFTDSKLNAEVTRPVITMRFEIRDVYKVHDKNFPDATEEEWIGAEHQERYFIKDLERDLGRVQALLADAGMRGAGPLEQCLAAFHGHEFYAEIRTRPDKNDKDRIYSNINPNGVRPLSAHELDSVPETTAGPPAGGNGAEQPEPEPPAEETQAPPAQPARTGLAGRFGRTAAG